MRGFKRTFTGILAAAMALSMTLSAGSAMKTEAASIKITPQNVNAVSGNIQSITYDYYQILKADIAPGASITGAVSDNGVVSYYLPTDAAGEAMKALIASDTDDSKLFEAKPSADGTKTIIALKESKSGEEVRDFLNTDDIKKAALKHDTFSYDASKQYAKVDNLEEGYYLVVSSLGSVVALQTVGAVDIQEKNTYIITHKETEETSYYVGAQVPYATSVTIPVTTKVDNPDDSNNRSIVILHDKMDNRLDFNGVVASSDIAATAYEVVENPGDGHTFDIKIPVTEDLLGKTIHFTYSATVSERAVKETGFINELFGELNGYKTIPDSPEVWTFGFDLDKDFADVEGDDAANFSATFKATDVSGNNLYFKKDGNKYTYAGATSGNGLTDELVVNGKENITILGVKAGTYTLTETATATGYNLLDVPVIVIITDLTGTEGVTGHKSKVEYKRGTSGDVTETDDSHTVTVLNKHGSLLPSTGGIGTTIFYIIGGLLIVAAAVFFVVRRRADAE